LQAVQETELMMEQLALTFMLLLLLGTREAD